jgi:hypothetical protein
MTGLDGRRHAPASEVWRSTPARYQIQHVRLPDELGGTQGTLLKPTAPHRAPASARLGAAERNA